MLSSLVPLPKLEVLSVELFSFVKQTSEFRFDLRYSSCYRLRQK